ncbi:MAG: 2-C-methyl-D-erythritol 2,4-cyclodiphosphate synthase [Bacillota bacterium]
MEEGKGKRKYKFAIVLCGGASSRFEKDKMSTRLFSGSVSKTAVEKFCDFDVTVVVLPREKMVVLHDIFNYMVAMEHEKKVRTWHTMHRTDLDSGIMRTRKPEMSDLFYESFCFPQREFDDYYKKRKRRRKPELQIPWDEETFRLIFWEMWELSWLKMKTPSLTFVVGGKTRTQSVRNGLVKILQVTKTIHSDAVVAIHDGARPFVSREQIAKTVTHARRYKSGVLAVPARDTMRKHKGSLLLENVDRDVVQIQTPQTFNMARLYDAYSKVEDELTDDSQVYSAVYDDCRYVQGGAGNFKITYPEDVLGLSYSCGFGYDVHQLESGKKFVLGGVEFQHNKGMVAHSDGDVLIHAICDAILSAIGKKDIGHQFPDTDEEFRGINSVILLERCVAMMNEAGRKIVSVSCMIMAEKPKIAPKIDDMQSVLSGVLNVNKSQVSISATTTEKLGIIGEEKGIACCCFILVN